jgi:hypothetical protein
MLLWLRTSGSHAERVVGGRWTLQVGEEVQLQRGIQGLHECRHRHDTGTRGGRLVACLGGRKQAEECRSSANHGDADGAAKGEGSAQPGGTLGGGGGKYGDQMAPQMSNPSSSHSG